MLKRAALSALAALALASCQPAPIHHWTEASPEVQAAHAPAEIQAYVDAYWRNVWIDTYWSRIAALTDAIERARVTYPSGQCGGDLPPCWVMMRESRGDIRAENPRSTASGKWQFLDGTWGGYGGYAHASHAPEQVQDERARQLWAGGRGCSHWSACR